jgi:hypothetical protein
MNTVCTIITPEYLPLAKALHYSLQKQEPGISLHVLVTGETPPDPGPGIVFHTTSELVSSPYYKGIENKYAHTNADVFRWALKPVFTAFLLQHEFDKVIFADPDLYFVGSFNFIFKELDQYDLLLTPHWANLDPKENEDSLLSVMKGGMFNAGFIAASRQAIPSLEWWASLCHYKMEKNEGLGLYDDQKYLDILPVQFERTGIIRHRGLNLASWNIDNSKREMIDGKLRINKKYEPVFIHFAKDTVMNILNHNDALLKPYLDEYLAILLQYNFDLLKNLDSLQVESVNSPLYKLKHRVRIRTRLKRFFFKLAEKL